MEQKNPPRARAKKRPTHPLITFLWALIAALVVINVMMIINLTAGTGSDAGSNASDLSSLDNISVEL